MPGHDRREPRPHGPASPLADGGAGASGVGSGSVPALSLSLTSNRHHAHARFGMGANDNGAAIWPGLHHQQAGADADNGAAVWAWLHHQQSKSEHLRQLGTAGRQGRRLRSAPFPYRNQRQVPRPAWAVLVALDSRLVDRRDSDTHAARGDRLGLADRHAPLPRR